MAIQKSILLSLLALVSFVAHANEITWRYWLQNADNRCGLVFHVSTSSPVSIVVKVSEPPETYSALVTPDHNGAVLFPLPPKVTERLMSHDPTLAIRSISVDGDAVQDPQTAREY